MHRPALLRPSLVTLVVAGVSPVMDVMDVVAVVAPDAIEDARVALGEYMAVYAGPIG